MTKNRALIRRRPASGFTLLEMGVVVVVIALIVAASLSMGQYSVETARRINTTNKLDAIENALMAFRVANNRLPCPADATLADPAVVSGVNYYAVESVNAGACTTGSGYDGNGHRTSAASPARRRIIYTLLSLPPGGNSNSPVGTTVAEGGVPVRTLNLPDDFMYDGWGRAFAYAVWTPLTAVPTGVPPTGAPAGFVNYGIYGNCLAAKVQNAGYTNRSTMADYVLVSYGSDGHGGYLKTGARYSSGSDNPDEKTNCHCDSTATDTGYAATMCNVTSPLIPPIRSTTSPTSCATRNAGRCKPPMMDSSPAVSCLARVSAWTVSRVMRPDTRWRWAMLTGMAFPISSLAPMAAIAPPVRSMSCLAPKMAFPIHFPYRRSMEPTALRSMGRPATMRVVLAVGDVNGDGISDIIIGAPQYNSATGRVYVVFGSAGWTTPLALSSLNGSNGIEIDGQNVNEYTGCMGCVATGDINGDGMADILIGAWGRNSNRYLYAVFGHGGVWTTPLALSSLSGANGVEFDGQANDEIAAVAAGDVNGDGVTDLVIGAQTRGGR